jgi:hypothetical protein
MIRSNWLKRKRTSFRRLKGKNSNDSRTTIAIVGGGVGGLAAALATATAGRSPHHLASRPRRTRIRPSLCYVWLTHSSGGRENMQNEHLVRANLRTPKAAAIAGMLFSLLLIAVFSLLRISVPADPQERAHGCAPIRAPLRWRSTWCRSSGSRSFGLSACYAIAWAHLTLRRFSSEANCCS